MSDQEEQNRNEEQENPQEDGENNDREEPMEEDAEPAELEPEEAAAQNQNFMMFLMRLMQEEDNRNKETKKRERKVVTPLQSSMLRSRRSELNQLLHSALPSYCSAIGVNVWSLIVSYLDAVDSLKFSQTCWAMRELCDTDANWEALFAREVGGVSLVTVPCQSWRQRFFLHQKMDDLEVALLTAEDNDEVILCPGVHVMPTKEGGGVSMFFGRRGLRVEKPVHILGCGFDRRYGCSLNWNHAVDVQQKMPSTGGNIVIQSDCTNALEWHTMGGSIRNVDIRYVNTDPNQYFFGLKVGDRNAQGSVELDNVGVSSSQQMAISVQTMSKVVVRNCRLWNSIGSGISVLDGAEAIVQDTLIEHNASGASVNSGSLVLERCVIHSNKLEGIGCSGEGSKLTARQCNVFGHKLNGVEAFSECHAFDVTDCDVHDNLNGVLRWVSPDVTASQDDISNSIEKVNRLHDNRRANCKVKIMREGQNLAGCAIEAGACTFSFTGPHFINQPVYNCSTCGLDNRAGCCKVCAEVCHQGHETRYIGDMDFYCDCGESFPKCSFRQDINEKVEEKVILGKK